MNEATRNYVCQHVDEDVRMLALRGSKDEEVDITIALQQIQGRQIARTKLPSWAVIDGILYPPHLNMEQCSSEQTALYKADVCQRLLEGLEGPTSLVDLTGGFGVDFAWMSEAFSEATYVEQNSELCAISTNNFNILNPHVELLNTDGTDYLCQVHHVTMIFLDPARRDNHGARTYGISDCTPNVLEIKEKLLQKADFVMLKLSPMLDWHKAVSDLGEHNIKEVHIVSVQNECKELIVVLSAKCLVLGDSGMKVTCTNILADNSCELFEFSPSAHHSSLNTTATPHLTLNTSHFIYEPNASIMKAGCFAEVEKAFGIHHLAPNSHLYTSNQLVDHFPGRIFQITSVSSMNKQELKSALQGIRQANIAVRNFPMSVVELRKKLKLGDGGETYIFATTLGEGKRIFIICKKLNSVNSH